MADGCADIVPANRRCFTRSMSYAYNGDPTNGKRGCPPEAGLPSCPSERVSAEALSP